MGCCWGPAGPCLAREGSAPWTPEPDLSLSGLQACRSLAALPRDHPGYGCLPLPHLFLGITEMNVGPPGLGLAARVSLQPSGPHGLTGALTAYGTRAVMTANYGSLPFPPCAGFCSPRV